MSRLKKWQNLVYAGPFICDQDPTNIQTVDSVSANLGNPAYLGVTADGNTAVLADDFDDDNITVFDVEHADNMAFQGELQGQALFSQENGVGILNDAAFIMSDRAQTGNNTGVVSVDISDPSNPTLLDELRDDTFYDGAILDCNAVIDPTRETLISTGNDRIYTTDISDPNNLATQDKVSQSNQAQSKPDYQSGFAYVPSRSGTGEFWAYDVTDPTAITLSGSLSDSAFDRSYDVSVDGDYAYVCRAGTSPGIVVVDVSTPSSPSISGTLSTGDFDVPEFIEADPNSETVYVTDASTDLLISVDVTTKSSPSVADTFSQDQLHEAYVRPSDSTKFVVDRDGQFRSYC